MDEAGIQEYDEYSSFDQITILNAVFRFDTGPGLSRS